MALGPTVNLVSDQLVACSEYNCEVYRNGSWQHLQHTLYRWNEHSSASTNDAVLLIGGSDDHWDHSKTEWVPVDGSPTYPGLFSVRHGYHHCTIQVSALTIVVTGGTDNPYYQDYVTEYQLNDITETPLTQLRHAWFGHACGSFQNNDGQQVSFIVMMTPIYMGKGTKVENLSNLKMHMHNRFSW